MPSEPRSQPEVRGVIIAPLAARHADRIVVGKATTVYLIGVECPSASAGTPLEVAYTIRNGRFEADEIRLATADHSL